MDTLAQQRTETFPSPAPVGSILVVEDDASILETISAILTDEGFRVHEAANGLEAIGVLLNKDLKPDLIFLDLRMPLMDGAELLDALAKQPVWKDIPVAILSAARDECTHPMVVERLRKPVEIEEIIACGHRYANQHLKELQAPPRLRISC